MNTMKQCILVDYENTQKIQDDGLDKDTTSIKFFIGKSQKGIPPELVQRFQKFGESVEWIRSSGNGENALDFHIAYTLGVMTTTNKEIEYIILSGDKGFDPLVSFLNAKGIKCKRVKSLDGSAAPNNPAPSKPKATAPKPAAAKPATTKSTTPKPADSKPEVDQTKRVIELIMKMKSPSHPKTVKKLKNTIKTHLGTKATPEDADVVFNEMLESKLIEVDQTKVTYNNK